MSRKPEEQDRPKNWFKQGHKYLPPKKMWDTPTRSFTEGIDRYFKMHPRKIDDMIKIAIERAIETKDLRWFDWIVTVKEGKPRTQTGSTQGRATSPDSVLEKARIKSQTELEETLDKIEIPVEEVSGEPRDRASEVPE